MESSPEIPISGEVKGEGAGEAAAARGVVERLRAAEDAAERVAAAAEIRRLTRTSARHRRRLSGAIEALVEMLRSGVVGSGEAAILALLNLAVRDERNKIKIVKAGALDPLISFLRSTNLTLQEYATAALLTLSASSVNKPTLSASGAIHLLIKILRDGNLQAKTDALMTLYNLSTITGNLHTILSLQPFSPLIDILKGCKKSSKTAEKCCALLECLLDFHEGRVALISEEGGVLAIVEVLEEGSQQGREHALGALLTMCESDRNKYREIILKEGVIPGLLELTIQGTPRSQSKARVLLELLRNTTYSRSQFRAEKVDKVVSDIVSQMVGEDQSAKAKKMLAEMVQVSMEQSLRHLQERALCVRTPANETPVG
ncbi:U-box domain-containing protein 4 [Ananas comosus]|uniref:U-box domain-containing protein 4 n=1 Tax=Ananas comosus TaxID=4615 RepID=A0A199UG45_ANACO|nr:U-box domain-containing protein 4 [Ananas comosus]